MFFMVDTLQTPVDLRTRRCLASLQGLSLGDAFGERFFMNEPAAVMATQKRWLPAAPWRYTDDTMMALSIAEVLLAHGYVHQDALATAFLRRYREDPARGYGSGMHRLMAEFSDGVAWDVAARAAFDGKGSMGNGAAMRVAPVGAYFAGNLATVTLHALRSAVVTHMHVEGVAGAIAVAVAAAAAVDGNAGDVMDAVLAHTPPGETRRGLEEAARLPLDTTPEAAALVLGSGQRVVSQDTVPFAVWCACRHLDNFEDALWHTVRGLGDRDTTCAIVGGILGARVGTQGMPAAWLQAREPLPEALVAPAHG